MLWMLGLAFVVVLVGAALTLKEMDRTLGRLKARRIEQVRQLVETMNAQRIRTFTGTPDDYKSEGYQRIRRQLALVGNLTPGCRALCLMGRRDSGEMAVYVNGTPEEFLAEGRFEADFSRYQAVLRRVYETGRPMIAEPSEDRWGRWLCAFAPIREPAGGACVAVLGMETSVLDWERCRWVAGAPAMAAALSMLIILAAGGVLLNLRSHRPGFAGRRLRYGDMLMVIAVGTVMTAYAALTAHRRELETRHQDFVQVADGRISSLVERIHDVGRIELEGLAALVHETGALSPGAFRRYTAHVSGHSAVRSWAWISATNGDGKHPSFPVSFVEPVADPGLKQGLDLGTDAASRSVLDEAARSGLPTLTLAPTDNDRGTVRPTLWVFRAVYDVPARDDGGRVLRGFVLAVMDPEALIGPAGDERLIDLAVRLVEPDGSVRTLGAPSGGCFSRESGAPALSRPLPAFGRVMTVEAHAGEDFLRLRPVREAVRMGVTGFLMTAALAAVALLLTRRREKLELLVAERTALLNEREQEYHQLIEHAIAAIATHEIVLDDGGRPVDYIFLSVNPAFETHTGLTADQVIGRRVREVLPGIEKTPFIDLYGTVVLTGEPVSVDQYSEALDRYFFIHAYPLGGRRFATVFSDITDRKKTEIELRESKERLMAVLNSIDAFVYVMDFDTYEILFVNDYGQKVWGDILGQTCYETLHHYDEPCPFCQNDRLRDEMGRPTGPQAREYLNRSNDRWYDVREYAVEWVDGRLVKMHIALDITERKQVERALSASREQFELAVRGSNDGIWDWDLREGSLFLSPQWKRQLGYEDGELPNRFESFTDNIHPDDKNRVMDTVDTYLAGTERRYELEFRMRHKDGTYRWILARGEAVRDDEGIPVRMAGSHTDITRSKEVEEELREINTKLEEAIARANDMAVAAETASMAKSDFLANMSHEIRTPMNGVIGMTGLLLDTPLSVEQRRYAQTIAASGESLLALINDILDFSKIEAGKLTLDTVDFDLTVLLEDVASALSIRFHEKGVELICSADPEVPSRLRGDPGRLRQVLINLSGNALKFTHEGEVEIRVSVDGERAEGGRVSLRFTVRDTGIGIPEDKQAVLFDKFTQVDASTSRQYGGTGLGLAISRQLVELMGGRIGVDSKPCRGSTFWFTAEFERGSGPSAEDVPELEGLAGVRVLIVDDNQTSRRILTARMMSWGMRPREARDGATAIQALYAAMDEGDPYRLAVIDKTMPSLDGEALGRLISAEPGFSDLRMVMLTSMGVRGDVRRLAELGFSGYLTKPVRPRELQGVLSLSLSGAAYAMEPPLATRHQVLEQPPRFDGGAARILLAEDNLTNQQVVQGMLERLNLSADVAENGRAAVEALDRQAYDLVLMDCQMPVMDGFAATREIRRRGHARLPIIALTAHAMQGDREDCLAAGMNDYLSKPLSTRALVTVLNTWLPDRPAAGDGPEQVEAGAAGAAEQSLSVWNRRAMLDRLDGDETLAKTVVDSFLSDVFDQLDRLKALLDDGDAAGAERQAHTLAGAASIVGGDEVETLARAMEVALREGRPVHGETALRDLNDACRRLVQALGDLSTLSE
ncbi:hypothetical protein JCM14469_01240 [Desulfatiferula olefinivorans]